ncbi:MAG: hypothetical protein Q4F79_03545 [Eubacteriales bacterium]|nr:hypothetical protein [Eubacteriales bacterium]
MNGSRMKQLLLRFLLVCNLIVLAVIAVFGVRNFLRIREQNQQMVDLLSRHGVTCGSSVYTALLEEKTAYTVHTDTTAQEAFCKRFLSEQAESEAQSGGSIVWSDDQGTIEWTSDGTVNGTVSWEGVTIPSDREKAEKLISRRMKAAGINIKQTAIASVTSEDGFIIRVQEGVDGKNLKDCELKFELSQSGSLVISGKWCFGTPERVVMDELDNSTPEDILLSLVGQNSEITQIMRAQRVYILSDKSGGRFTILPCWKIVTDQGEYILDPLTGLPAESVEDSSAEPFANEQTTENSTQSELRPGTDTTTDTDDATDTNSDWITAQAEEDEESGQTGDTTDETVNNDSAEENSETSATDPELPDEHGIYG